MYRVFAIGNLPLIRGIKLAIYYEPEYGWPGTTNSINKITRLTEAILTRLRREGS